MINPGLKVEELKDKTWVPNDRAKTTSHLPLFSDANEPASGEVTGGQDFCCQQLNAMICDTSPDIVRSHS